MKFTIKVGVAIVLLLGGVVILFSNGKKQDLQAEVKDIQTDSITVDTNQNSQETLVFQITTEEVNKIIIDNRGERIELLPTSPYSEEEVRTNLSGWYVHQPYKNVYSVKYNKMSDILYGLANIKRGEILTGNEKSLEEYGLVNANFKISIASKDKEETILIGVPATSESRYAKLETDDRVFTIHSSALEPYSYQAFDIVEKFVKIVAIDVLKQLTIQFTDQEVAITVEHQENLDLGFTIDINGDEIEANKFRQLYKSIAGLSVKEEIGDAKYGPPAATMIYTILDSDKGENEVKVEFVPYNNKSFAVFIDHKADFIIEKKEFFEMIKLITNQN
ncbi:DUF4340 domain-containing protein [Sporosarcina sp. FSL K6-3457]|uniref:DUF4340 domain-containing protein n=1 Tax=Sporosarcina sp. FSL K6-3457 TaxID=2978204 RepID=UPI0030FBA453